MSPSSMTAPGRHAQTHGAAARPAAARAPGGAPASGDAAGGFAGLLQSITPPVDEAGAQAPAMAEGSDGGTPARKRADRSRAHAGGAGEEAATTTAHAPAPARDETAAASPGELDPASANTGANAGAPACGTPGDGGEPAREGLDATGPAGRPLGRVRAGALPPQAAAEGQGLLPPGLAGHTPPAHGLHTQGLAAPGATGHLAAAGGAQTAAASRAIEPHIAGANPVAAAGPLAAADVASAATAAGLDAPAGAAPAPRGEAPSFAATLAGLAPDAASAAWTPPASPMPSSPLHQAALACGPHQAGFAGEVAAQVQFMVTGQLQQAELHLNPVDLGPVRITLDVSGDQASLHLAAAHALTREGLQRALPELREALASQGLSLGQAEVGTHAGQGRGEGHAQAQERASQAWGGSGGATRHGDGAGSDGAIALRPAAPRARALRGMLDLYA